MSMFRLTFLVALLCVLTVNVTLALTVAPERVDFGTIVLEYGQSFEKRVQFVVSDCPESSDTDETAKCSVFTDRTWLRVETTSFECGNTASVVVEIPQTYEPGSYEGTVNFACAVAGQPAQEQSVDVELYLVRTDSTVEDRLVISPESMNYTFPRSYLVPKEFEVKIQNANPEHPYFTWSAHTDAYWVKLSRTEGVGNSSITVTVDPSLLTVGTHTARVTFYSSLYDPDWDGDGVPEKDTATLNITVSITASDAIDVEPTVLFWSFVKDSDGNIEGDTHPKLIHVIKGTGDVYVTADAPWILLKKGVYLTPGEEEFDTEETTDTTETTEETTETTDTESEFGPCGTKTSCSEMTSCDEAMYYYETCGLTSLDEDADGVPCDDLCATADNETQDLFPGIELNINLQLEESNDDYFGSQDLFEEVYTVYLDLKQLQYYDYGRYEGYITVHGPEDGFTRKVLVVVQIRHETDPVIFPLLPVDFNQVTGDYMSAEFAVSYPISFQMPVYYQGTYEPFDMKVFMILESPNSDFLWAYQPWMTVEGACSCLSPEERGKCRDEIKRIVVLDPPVFKGLIPVKWRYADGYYAWANCLYYSYGPVAEIEFGPQVPLFTGRYIFKVFAGKSIEDVNALRVVELKVDDISGCWYLTDEYEGKTYQHTECLRLETSDGVLSGSWYGQNLVVYPGDMQTYVFGFLLSARGKVFEYQVQYIDDTTMRGRWRYYDEDGTHEWNTFTGVRL